eukprot:TRINITY_DN76980_c0_g1_i1.p1 TRINITY_DN76980_c0_g1~~TRINITY_DN76980_c0_g1_i1.p1  ORF type:complete len:327 (-),score=81.78 TRINITY_DN76980_c0_g1_i1:102-1061(-)
MAAGYAAMFGGPAPSSEGSEGSELREQIQKLFGQIKDGTDADVLQTIDTELGGDVNIADELGMTPLIRSIICRKSSLAQALIERRADIMKPENEGDNPLMFAISLGQDEALKTILAASADADVPNRIGQTPLMKAVNAENLPVVQRLLEWKVNVNATTEGKLRFGKTALLVAAEKNNVDIAEELVKAGADALTQDERGHTPLFPAAFRCNTAMLELLLKARADAAAKGKFGNTALTMALDSFSFKAEAMKLLLDSGSPVDTQDPHGDTALIKAVEEGRDDAAKLLVEAKADLTLKNKEGKSALDVAREKGNSVLVELLS